MTDNPDIWNKAYATGLREFAADLEAKLKAGNRLEAEVVVQRLHMYADKIWPLEDGEASEEVEANAARS